MSHQNQNENYLGNPNIKKDGIVTNFTEEQVKEYALCMKDPVFYRNICKDYFFRCWISAI